MQKEGKGYFKLINIVTILLLSAILIPGILAATVGHGAPAIGSGMFESGNYTFPDSLFIKEYFNVSDLLWVDPVTSRVGIGTTAPGDAKLNVTGTIDAWQMTINGSAVGAVSGWTDDGAIVRLTASTDSVGIGTAVPGDALLNVSGTIDAWQVTINGTAIGAIGGGWTDDGAIVRLASSGDIVGIGTSTPEGGKLYVAGNGTYTGDLVLGGDLVGTEGSGASGAGLLGWVDDGTVVRLATSTDFVGIGTSTPGALLEVTNGSAYEGLLLNVTNGATDFVYNATTGNVGIGTTTPAQKLHIYGTDHTYAFLDAASGKETALKLGQSGTVRWTILSELGTPSSYLGFYDNANSLTSMVIENGTGNVGIGTSSPGARLEVVGTANISNGSDVGIYFDSTNNLVGIGTTSPNVLLDVRKAAGTHLNIANFLNTDSTTATQTYMWLGQSLATGRAGYIGFIDNTDAASGYLALTVYGDNPATGTGLFVKKGGNVGIGTTTPQKSLQINGESSYGMLRLTPSVADAESSMGFFNDTTGTDTNDAWVIGQGGWSNTGDFVIGNENNGAGGDVRMLIEKSGSVGIGTADPSGGRLVVKQSSNSPGGTLRTIRSDTTGYADWFAGADGNAYVQLNGADYCGTTGGGTAWACASDERKKDIQGGFTRGLSDLTGINPVLFRLKASGPDSELIAGFSAQNILASIPEAVGIGPDGFYTVGDRPILAATVNAIKELNTKVHEQQAQIGDLKSENEALKSLVCLDHPEAEVCKKSIESVQPVQPIEQTPVDKTH